MFCDVPYNYTRHKLCFFAINTTVASKDSAAKDRSSNVWKRIPASMRPTRDPVDFVWSCRLVEWWKVWLAFMFRESLRKKRGSRTSPNFEHQGLARSWPPSIVRSSMTRCDGLDSGDLTHSPDSRRGVFQWRLAAAKNAAGTTFFGGLESDKHGVSNEAF